MYELERTPHGYLDTPADTVKKLMNFARIKTATRDAEKRLKSLTNTTMGSLPRKRGNRIESKKGEPPVKIIL